jgi:hypothetical protein
VSDVSPAQSAERVASEAEAARSEADAIRDITGGHQEACVSVLVDPLHVAQKGKAKQLRMCSNPRGFSVNLYRYSILDCSASEAFLLCILLYPVPVSTVLASQKSTSTVSKGARQDYPSINQSTGRLSVD